MSSLENEIKEKDANKLVDAAKKLFKSLVQPGQYVGEVYSISYETALVQIHDHHRKKVGGIPSLSFLIATRVTDPEEKIDYSLEDSSIILLRVMDASQLPGDVEAERIRTQSAQRVSGEISQHWDSPETMDAQTNNLLSFAGIKCRVIGTFFLENNNSGDLSLKFGSDLSNYYPNKGLKVFKPNQEALQQIVNYQDPERKLDLRNQSRVSIGEIRYASTNRAFQGVSNVTVSISPADLLEQKTALFGMTRTGKSNTTKIIAKSVFDLRFDEKALRIGQVIFDPNGEYANENTQDSANKSSINKTALKNVWRSNKQKGVKEDVVTYGVLSHPDDPDRKLMLINFYDETMLQIGKEMINIAMGDISGAQYITNFCLVEFNEPDKKYFDDKEYQSEITKYKRRVLVYRTLLKKAGFALPAGMKPVIDKLFNKDLIAAMQGFQPTSKEKDFEQAIKSGGDILSTTPNWDALAAAFEGLYYFLKTDTYTAFNTAYIRKSSTGQGWADPDLRRLLEMFAYPKATNLMGVVATQHTSNVSTDYADDIYKDLMAGRLVIVDQSSGEPKINESVAERVMWKIFRENQKMFRAGKLPQDILIYIEEAHNLLPSDKETDLTDIWVRTAKEGAKYKLGMIYVTQEVSSIQKNILKNTSNWFIGHLNNTDETRELKKFYDFADFESSIIRAQDKGFLRVKTLSNLFVIPVQVKKFELPTQ
ncbi:MAG: DUF87 domain-containing protein [Anaerolineales bacterium]|nr:DUF87 domain-containing protein [Anaerolineales bacterium]